MIYIYLFGGLFLVLDFSSGLKSSHDYTPKANSPILYSPGVDPILQLDPETFEDTIFDPENTNAFVVEFYADW